MDKIRIHSCPRGNPWDSKYSNNRSRLPVPGKEIIMVFENHQRV